MRLMHNYYSETQKVLRRIVFDTHGTIMMEALVASAVFSLVGVAVLSGLSTMNLAGAKTDEQSVAENITRNQIEFLFSRSYREPDQTPYPTIALPTGYTVSVTSSHVSGNIDPEVEKVGVTVSHYSQPVLYLETARLRKDGLRLLVSDSSDRSNPVRLQGHSLTGTVYVFLDDPDFRVVGPVNFYLDGAGTSTEDFIHWDFQGTTGVTPSDPANPWVATVGAHTILANAVLANGETVNITADFTGS